MKEGGRRLVENGKRKDMDDEEEERQKKACETGRIPPKPRCNLLTLNPTPIRKPALGALLQWRIWNRTKVRHANDGRKHNKQINTNNNTKNKKSKHTISL